MKPKEELDFLSRSEISGVAFGTGFFYVPARESGTCETVRGKNPSRDNPRTPTTEQQLRKS
jgi:hypothetical protein